MRCYFRTLSRIGLGPGVVLGIALMLGWVFVYWHLSQLASELFVVSRPGARALFHYLRADYAEAARAYRDDFRRRAIGSDSSDRVGYWALRAGNLDVAERRAHASLARVPANVEPLITLGEVALERNDVAAAMGHLQEVRRRQPDHPDALYLFAVAATRAGDPAGTIEALNRGLRSGSAGRRDTVLFRIMEVAGELAARPEPERPVCLLALLHRYLRIFDESQARVAEAYARRAIAARDHPADAYLTVGVLLDKRGRYGEALAAFQDALAVKPDHAEALRWAAVEAWRRADLLLQYRMIKAAFEAAPTDPFYLEDLATVMVAQLGDLHGMAAFMERALELDETNAAAHEQLGRAAAGLGDPERARRHLERARALRDAAERDLPS